VALRQYQQKQGIPVSGTADAETLKQLQISLPASPSGAAVTLRGDPLGSLRDQVNHITKNDEEPNGIKLSPK
jgi:hypothetical protein